MRVMLDGAYNYVRNGDFATTKGLELSLGLFEEQMV